MESHKCVVCKKEKPDVKRRINPYKRDVEDLVVWQYLSRRMYKKFTQLYLKEENILFPEVFDFSLLLPYPL